MFKKERDNQGFTLIEIMVVVVIISIMAMYVGPKIMGRPQEAKINSTAIQIKSIETALNMYKLDTGTYPTTEQGLDALVQPPEVGQLAKNWKKGGYMDKGKVPKDPWKNEYIYISPGINNSDSFDLSSYGPDGQPGGEDENKDINNWEIE